MDKISAAISCSSGYSLRMLDWLVTNMAKRTMLRLPDATGKSVYVHEDYRVALSEFRRRNFDPFRRSQRTQCGTLVEFVVIVHHPQGDLRSTLGQVNFLEWAWRMGVLDYTTTHAKRIEKDMHASGRRRRGAHETSRGKGLSDKPMAGCHAFDCIQKVGV